MRNSIRKITISVLILSIFICLTGCAGKISSDDTSSSADESRAYYSYLLLDTELKEFNATFNLYLRTHASEMKVDNGTGKTYNGEECTFMYTTTNMYKSLTLTKSYSDKMVVDEYFKLDDGALFMARSTAFSDGTFAAVEKYVVRDNKVLFLNEDAKSVETIADLKVDEETKVMADKDMFLHFEDIEYVYEQS